MKKVTCLSLFLLLLFTVFGCQQVTPDTSTVEVPVTDTAVFSVESSDATLEATSLFAEDMTEETTEENSEGWRTVYAEYLEKFIAGLDGNYIYTAYVGDIDGDGVPMVAISYANTTMQHTDLVLNWSNGELVVGDFFEENHTAGSGTGLLSKNIFIKGTNYLVYHALGGHQGSLDQNYLRIYDIVDGKYELIKEYSVDLSEYVAENPTAFYVGSEGLRCQKDIVVPEFDRIINETCKSSDKLVYFECGAMYDQDMKNNAQNCAVSFCSAGDPDASNEKGIAYLEKELEITLN